MNFLTKKNPSRSIRLELGIVLIAVAAVTLPFIAKPVQLDGVYFLDLARAKLESPLRDSIPEYDFAGVHLDEFRDTHPPFLAYYLAGVMRIAGGANEKLIHLSLIPFALLAGGAGYFVARRFTRDSLFAALLLVVSPGFVVLAGDIMTDIPMLAFWLAASATYIYGLDRGSRPLLILSGVFIALAFFTSFESLALIPLLLLYAILARRMGAGAVLPLVIALAAFFGYLGAKWYLIGEVPRLRPQSSSSIFGPGVTRFFPKMTSVFLSLGGAIIFPPAVLAAFWPRKKQIWDYAIIVVLFVLFPLILAFLGAATWGVALHMVLFLPAAGLLIYGFVDRLSQKGEKRRNWIFLSLWMAGIVFYTGVVLYHAAVKYLLPAFLPVAILMAMQARSRFDGSRALAWFQSAAVAATAVLAFLVAGADYELAAGYRDFARETVPEELGEYKTGWFSGEFGWRYYLEQQGFRYLLTNDQRPQPGDIVLQPIVPGSSQLSADLSARTEKMDEKVIRGRLPVKIIHPPSGAGFYGHRWGLLPYAFSERELDHVYIYRVVK